MQDIETTKQKITSYVNAYRFAYPAENQQVIKQVKINREKNPTRTGDLQGKTGTDILERPLYEISETLFSILNLRLDDEERGWLESIKGAQWFAKAFPEFSRVEKV